jgi:hypothetical protein
MKALNIYLKAESERISDDEIKLQIPILLGAIEAIKVFTIKMSLDAHHFNGETLAFLFLKERK